MKEQGKLFGIDFVRASAVFLVIIMHYNMVRIAANPADLTLIRPSSIAGVQVGTIGVSLFFIISAVGLTMSFARQNSKQGISISLKRYAKRRFMSIFPAFWICYLMVAIFQYVVYSDSWLHTLTQIPKWKFVYTLFGLDGTLSISGDINFYLIGEWFLGVLILFYLIFPFLYAVIKKCPILMVILLFILFAWRATIYGGNIIPQGGSNDSLIFRVVCIAIYELPSFSFGIYFGLFWNKFSTRLCTTKVKITLESILALISVVLLVIFVMTGILTPHYAKIVILGVLIFFILFYLGQQLQKFTVIRKISLFIGDRSYYVFLVHHIIIAYLTTRNPAFFNYSKIQNYLYFIFTVVVIFIISSIAEVIVKNVMQICKKMISFQHTSP
ncbi:MAG: acyltransferase [Candidatus Ancillula sp.]|jgi:peptidoglycan/LPS O-acetylase OafA/YrhL|nr:acyltransferase [Candidatus Ancillula sp.]